jgi:hypothetical protein
MMELRMEYNEEEKRDEQCEGERGAAARRGVRERARRRASNSAGSARATRGDGPENPRRRYERFEPITVRAAARVLHLQRGGVVSAREAWFYLRELAAMDAHAGPGAFPSLARMAQRRACARPIARGTGGTGPGPGCRFSREGCGCASPALPLVA